MRYLWTDYDSNRFYCSAEILSSPYEEHSDVYRDEKSGKTVHELNPLIRLDEIFLPLFKLEQGDENDVAPDDIFSSKRRHIENVLYHFLAGLDRLCGKHDFSMIEERLDQELRKGGYGQRAKDLYVKLTEGEQRIVARNLRRQEACDETELRYVQAVHDIFPGSRVYYYHDEQRFVVWIPQRETSNTQDRLELLKILFLDLTCNEPQVFWERHVGVMGIDIAPRVDEAVVY